MEGYLTDIKNIVDRVSMSKLRLSNHRLVIETGRHKKIGKLDRKCPFCPSKIEDEEHFLTTCPTYNIARDKLLAEIPLQIQSLRNDRVALFQYLMKGKNILRHTAKFITNAFSTREFLLAKHRNDM